METVISCRGLTKDYGQGHGLFDTDLEINRGEVFGLIGPNGAGKSTLIKLVMNLVRPSRGKASVFGLDAKAYSAKIKKRVGYLPGELLQFPGVRAGYILKLLLNMRGIKDQSRMLELASRLKLDLSKKYQTLSHGNKQKVGLVQAFMHNPELVILDEPTLGLDPMIQKEFRAIVSEFRAAGGTVVLSSHVLSEVETICDRVGLIDRGRIIRDGSLKELRGDLVHKIQLRTATDGAITQRLLDELRALEIKNIETEADVIRFDAKGNLDPILKVLAKYEVVELDSRELSLEEVFFTEVAS